MKTVKSILKFENNAVEFLMADIFVIVLVVGLAVGLMSFVDVSNSAFVAEVPIDTSLSSLPGYSILSLTRGLIALVLSYIFAIAYGTIAARKPSAERIMIPLLDVLQSLPVVSFMPGFVFSLTMLFPHSRWGLELACILMIFTGQVWNLVFAYYESQTAMPVELREVSQVAKLTTLQRFFVLDLPNGIRPLVYNGMMSMAGGWFFLTLCEAFPLGNRNFRLPGLGSYLKVAFESQHYSSFIAGIAAIMCLIIGVDFFLWKPLIAWSARFRDSTETGTQETSLFLDMIEKARVFGVISSFLNRASETAVRMKDKNLRAHHIQAPISSTKDLLQKATASTLEKLNFEKFPWKHTAMKSSATSGWQAPLLSWIISFGAGGAVFYFLPNLPKLASAMGTITHSEWLRLINALLLTSAKIAGVLFIATLWTVPVGVWIGKNPRISKIAQPIVQNIAAFPAPVLFPLIALGMHRVGMSPGIISMCLMTIGNQWYMFFNVISGASRIPDELQLVARLYRFSTRDRWRKLYLPAIFPSLVTGWITAAGGSWNASIVAELVTFPGGEVRSPGIGLALAEAAAQGHTERLIAAVAVVTIALVVLNRSLWRSLHIYAEKVKAT